jgi:opacity protein-like surface antigen
MKKKLTIAALLLSTTPLFAQDWSLGAGTGAFAFGDFVKRTMRGPGSPDRPSRTVTTTLTADVRAGLAVDLERRLSDRWAVRLEGAFTRSPLSIEDSSGGQFNIEAGDLDVTTFMLPIVFRINTGGTFRFHLLGGPAYALYRTHGLQNADASVNVFKGSRSQWGGAAGAGVAWQLSDRFALEGEVTDIVTSSPFHRSDFSDTTGLEIPKPHNVHTKLGVRYRF